MQCSQCGHKMRGRALFCPICGHKLESPAGQPVETRDLSREAYRVEEQPREGCGLSIAAIIGAIVAIIAIVGLGVLAVRYGLNDRADTEREAAQEHYQKGVAYLSESQYELAIAEFELVLKLDPEDEQAATRLADAQSRLDAVPTATPALQIETKAALLQELRKAHQDRDWQQVYTIADRIIALDAEYHRDEIDEVLFEAYYNDGLQLVEEDRLQEAVRLFEQALGLQPDDTSVARSRDLATLYLSAMGYWGADWTQAATDFRALYELQPDYKDVRQRLHDAYANSAEMAGEEGDWCSAAEQYALATEVLDDAATIAKQQTAAANCTETAGDATTTPDTTEMPSDQQAAAASGAYVGTLVEYTGLGGEKLFVRGMFVDSEGKGVGGIRVQIKAWDWSAVAVTDGNGLYSFDGLSNPVTYTLMPLDVEAEPFDVEGIAGQIAWVNFVQTP